MAAILTILLPIFGLVLAGYGGRRTGVFGPAAAVELNRFVVWLALPALLFDIIVHSSWQQLWQPRFIAAFGLATTGVFVLVLVVRLRSGRHLVDAAVDAMAASYSNTGYVGFPLSLLAFGRSSQTPATIATLFVVCVLFALALVLIEIGLSQEVSASKVATRLASSLSRNPLLVGPALGLLVAALGWRLPAGVETFFRLLGSSASPCALVSLGVFLAEKSRPERSDRATAPLLAGTKLLLLPAVTWALAVFVFELPPLLVDMAVLLTALPTGTGPFMLAQYYGREAVVSSRTVLLSTTASVLTLSVLLYLQQAR